jgi:hypothetical protein
MVLWEQWIQQLERLPPEAAEWSEAEAFLERLRARVDENREHVAKLLSAAWVSLRDECAEELQFFDAAELAAASPVGACQADTLNLVKALRAAMCEYRQTRDERSQNVRSERARRVELGRQEHAILSALERLRESINRGAGTAVAEFALPPTFGTAETRGAPREAAGEEQGGQAAAPDIQMESCLLGDSPTPAASEILSAAESSLPGGKSGVEAREPRRTATQPPRLPAPPSGAVAAAETAAPLDSPQREAPRSETSRQRLTSDSRQRKRRGQRDWKRHARKVRGNELFSERGDLAREIVELIAEWIPSEEEFLEADLLADEIMRTATGAVEQSSATACPAEPASEPGPMPGSPTGTCDATDASRDAAPNAEPAPSSRVAEPPSETAASPETESSKPPEAEASAPPERFVCHLIQADDLAGAYWWLRSREASGQPAVFPSWLLEAVQASRWRPDEDLSVAAELGPIASAHELPTDLAGQLLALAAALLPALTLPLVDVRHWLPVKLPLPRLAEVVQVVRRFAEHGQKIRIQELGSRLPRDEAEAQVVQAAAAARLWLEHAVNKTTSFQRGSHVWLKLVRDGGPLHAVLSPAATDRRRQAESLSRQLDRWSERGTIVNVVHELDSPLKKRRHDAIEGTALDQIVLWTYEACELAKHWCGNVLQLQRLNNSDNWLEQQIDRLRADLQSRLPGAIDELASTSWCDGLLQRAAAQVVLRSLQQLSGLLEPAASEGSGREAVAGRGLELEGPPPRGLRHRLARRLLTLPEIDLHDDGQPTEASLAPLAGFLEQAELEQRPLTQALHGWFARQDFRFTDELLEPLRESPEWKTLWEEYRACHTAAKHSLEARRDELDVRIENAVIDGVLSEDQRAELQEWLLALDSDLVRDFSAAHHLGDEVVGELARAYGRHCAAQREEWESQRELLLGEADAEARRHIEKAMGTAFDRLDARLLHEYLSQLQAARAEGTPPTLLPPGNHAAPFEKFLARYEAWIEAAVLLAARSPNTWESIRRNGNGSEALPESQRMEAERVLEAWNQLRSRALTSGDPRTTAYLLPVLAFLGFKPAASGMSVEILAARRKWTHLQVKMTEGRPSPVPQFGSLRRDCYDVLCVWEDPGAQSLLAIINEAGLALQPTIVLYLGVLSLAQRANLGRLMQHESLPAVVLDDVLLVYLAAQREARWPIFLRIALPYSGVNPYLPGSAGNVPREMFFGRKQMIASLADFTGSGSCLVYGGRQLGKSALLRRVQQLCHDPARGQYALYEEIRNLGDPLADKPAELIWTVIRDELNALGFFEKAVTAGTPRLIIDHIRKRLDADPQSRLLILLDEADSFLENDAEQNFQHVTDLKNLMERTDRRVKVIFAGLHNVQRFQGIPNQPFAHLGLPLEVGTLEPAAAKALVQIPLETVGYRFADESLVLKILSYTNYHPGLIQLFCHKLLTEFHKRRRSHSPPYPIDDTDVRAVYARAETQRDFRDRFNWTLRLDERYSAIIWSVIDDQYERAGSRAAVYSPAELLERVRVCWPAAFGEMLHERFRGLLDELCGLGILLRVADGYRLRSPNVMQLIGDREEIVAKLNELEHRPAPTVGFKADSHRVLLGRTGRRSPLTFAQSRQLGRPQFGAGLIFASPAQGWDDLAAAAAQLLPREEPGDGTCESTTTRRSGGQTWETWLRDFLEAHRHYERLILLAHVDSPAAEIELVVRQAIKFCQRRGRTERQWLRILLCFDAAGTWAWHALPAGVRRELENAADALAHLARWDEDAILFHLKQADQMNLPAVGRHLLRATGGWPILLDEVFRRCGEADDPREAADLLAAELRADTPWRNKFRAALGLDSLPQASEVIELLRQLGEGSFEPAFLALVLEEPPNREWASCGFLDFLLALQIIEPDDGSYRVNEQVAQVLKSS